MIKNKELNKLDLMRRILSIIDNYKLCEHKKLNAIKNLIDDQYLIYFNNIGYQERWSECFNGLILNCEIFTPSPSGDEEKGK